MKFPDWLFPEDRSILFYWRIQYSNEFKKRVFLFEPPCDLQPIMCFNIIPWSKRYSLFPIFSSLIGPSLRNFRISLSNGLFSPVGIGRSIPSPRTVLESFLPHTAQRSILLVSHFNLPYLNDWQEMSIYPLFLFLGLTRKVNYMSFKLEFWSIISFLFSPTFRRT